MFLTDQFDDNLKPFDVKEVIKVVKKFDLSAVLLICRRNDKQKYFRLHELLRRIDRTEFFDSSSFPQVLSTQELNSLV